MILLIIRCNFDIIVLLFRQLNVEDKATSISWSYEKLAYKIYEKKN